jgi:hypothetical protein
VLYSSLLQATKANNISYAAVRNRLISCGLNPTQAEVDECFNRKIKNGNPIKVRGQKYLSLTEACDSLNVNISMVTYRLRKLEQLTPEEIDKCFYQNKIINNGITVEGVWYGTIVEAAKKIWSFKRHC